MTSYMVRSLLDDVYEYRFLDNKLVNDKMKQKIMKRYQKITDKWNTALNSEWVLRNYLAIKMIMGSSLLLNSLIYSKKNNLKVVEPYLHYYSLFTACRSLIFVISEIEWKNGEIMTMNHSKTINIITSELEKIDGKLSKDINKLLLETKDMRELFSYKFPASGLSNFHCDSSNHF